MRVKSIVMLLLVSFAAVGVVCAQKNKKKKEVSEETKQAIKTKVESARFVIQINHMASQGGDMEAVEFGRYLQMMKDSSDKQSFRLRAPVISMEGPLEEYKLSTNKKGMMIITFGINTTELYYNYTVEIQPDGQSTIKILSNFNQLNQRAEMWYYGNVHMPELEAQN